MTKRHFNNPVHLDPKQLRPIQRLALYTRQDHGLYFALTSQPIIYEFSDYANHRFNAVNPASFRYEGLVYKPIKKLAEGVYGETWLCTSSDPNRSLALKREKPDRHGKYTEGDELEKEADLNRQIHGIGALSGDPKNETMPHYLVMRLIDGMTLGETFRLFDISRPASPEIVLRIWILFAAAILDFHKRGLVHGDLHANNAIVSMAYDLVKLIDFGLTKKEGELRTDCTISKKRAKKYPFRPPETFSDLPNPQVYADQNQDIWSAGYALSGAKKLCEKSFRKTYPELGNIIFELNRITPANRIPLDVAICKIISAYFQESVRAMPPAPIPEWVVITGAVIQMRMNELFVAISQPSIPDKKEGGANALTDKKAQHEELENIMMALKNDFRDSTAESSAKPRHERLFNALNETTYASCPFLPGGDTVRLLQKIMTSFFPLLALTPKATESVLHSLLAKAQEETRAHADAPPPELKRQQPRSNTPPVGVRPQHDLYSSIPIPLAFFQKPRANTPPIVRPKKSLSEHKGNPPAPIAAHNTTFIARNERPSIVNVDLDTIMRKPAMKFH